MAKERWKPDRKAYLNMRSHLKIAYGITVDEYLEMLDQQNGGCAICDAPYGTKQGGRLHVDHNKETGQVRGLLCGNCNRALGQLNHDPNQVLAAAIYLVTTDKALQGV